MPPPSEYVADGAASQAAWALAGGDEPPAWELAGAATYEAEPAPEVRQRYAACRDHVMEAAGDNGAASPDTIAASWRAPPGPPVVGSSTERTGNA